MYEIEFVNLGQTIQVGPDETILDVALDAGLSIDYGCLYGDCAACVSRLLSGEVARGKETGLSMNNSPPSIPSTATSDTSGAELLLLCVARPRSDCRIWIGTDE